MIIIQFQLISSMPLHSFETMPFSTQLQVKFPHYICPTDFPSLGTTTSNLQLLRIPAIHCHNRFNHISSFYQQLFCHPCAPRDKNNPKTGKPKPCFAYSPPALSQNSISDTNITLLTSRNDNGPSHRPSTPKLSNIHSSHLPGN